MSSLKNGPWIGSILDRLIEQDVATHDLRTLVFDPLDRSEVMLFRRRLARKPPYPCLRAVREAIARTCNDSPVCIEDPKRIWFFDDRINIEFDDAAGEPGLISYRIADGVLHQAPPASLRRRARNWSVAVVLAAADMCCSCSRIAELAVAA